MVKCKICNTDLKRITHTHLKKHDMTLFEYIDKYGNDLIDKKKHGKLGVTKKSMIEKYGYDEGIKRFDSYRKKQAYSNSYEYKQQKYGWSKQEFKDFNKNRSMTKDLCIKRHGEYKGLKLWKEYCDNQSLTKSKEFMIDKYDKKYWDALCKQKSQSLENYIKKYGYKDGFEKFKKYCSKNRFFGSKSSIENSFYNELQALCFQKLKQTHYINTGKKYFFVDIFCKPNKIIEFFGDYWHMNPNLYDADFKFKLNNEIKLAKDIWNKDNNKIKMLKSSGYDVLIIWENDFKSSKEKVLIKCIKWLNQ